MEAALMVFNPLTTIERFPPNPARGLNPGLLDFSDKEALSINFSSLFAVLTGSTKSAQNGAAL